MERSSDAPGEDAPAFGDDVLGAGDSFSRALTRWAADAVVDEAAIGRARARWMRTQAEEEASFLGALVDLAERGLPVVVEVADQRLRGVLAGIGADFVALHADHGQRVLVRLEAVDAVRAGPGSVEVRGDRPTTFEVTLQGVLVPMAADRPDVQIRTRRGVVLRGELRSAGTDVVRLRVAGDPPTPAWVPLDAVAVLVLG